ncbi:MAG: hypothetical protein SFX73_13200, partial [Kofleriaceae bacterium]|nr:hypothetical protein [Kofleriaceae bacterium]
PPPVDADPAMLALSGVAPATIYEGQGDVDGGSRPAVVVVSGSNFDGAANPSIAITLADGSPAPLEVVTAELRVDAQFSYLVVPVRVPVNVDLDGASGPTNLKITVAQDIPGGGRVQRELLTGLKVQMLPELEGATTLQNRLAPYEYARVNGSITASAGEHPVRVHSWSRMTIDGVTGLSASGATAGPAGGAGAGQAAGGQAGNMGGGPSGGDGGTVGVSGLLGGAGGNGKNGKWLGSELLPTLGPANTHRSSGGGSGGGGVTTLGPGGAGGPGGGGGGALQLRADGHLTIPNSFSAAGAAGSDVSGNGGGGGNGTGGSVVLQAGGTLDVAGTISVAGGGSGAEAAPPGKIRYDAPALSINTAIAGYRGPAFVAGTPAIVTVPRPMLSVVGTAVSTAYYYLVDATGSSALLPIELGPSETPFTLGADLKPGLNQVCLVVDGAEKGSDTRSCIDVVYVR